ncbi:MAG: hypothetical protein R2881_09810 [Eubacteriales bacterium]
MRLSRQAVRISFRGLRIVADCANGAASFIAKEVFERLGAEVTLEKSCAPDGI